MQEHRHPEDEKQTQVAMPRSKDSQKKRLMLNCFMVSRETAYTLGIHWIYSSLLPSNNEILYNQYQFLSFHKTRPLGKEVNLSMACWDSPSCSTNSGQLGAGSTRKQTWFPHKPHTLEKVWLIPYTSADDGVGSPR